MARNQNKVPTTYRSIMAVVVLFLTVDLIITGLLIFNVDLTDFGKKDTDNTSFNVVTDNTVPMKTTDTPPIKSDNVIKP